jgi:rod shape-determining protein MreC
MERSQRPAGRPAVSEDRRQRVKDVFRSTGTKILVAVLFLMLGLMLYTSNTGSSLTAKLFGRVAIPMQRVSTMVANNAATVAQASGKSKAELEAENEQLRRQVAEMNKKLVNYYTYQQENAQLRKFLEMKNENRDFKPVAAAVVGRDPNNIFGQFTIDQGTQSGISQNDPVVTENGVVGWVSSASATYSKVTTLLSPETKISAVDKVTREAGVVGCDLRSADANTVRLQYLSAGAKVAAGDIVVTNGIGGVFPRNLIVGTVKAVKHSTSDISLYAEVTPAVNVKEVRDVMVITSFLGKGEALPAAASPSSSGAK